MIKRDELARAIHEAHRGKWCLNVAGGTCPESEQIAEALLMGGWGPSDEDRVTSHVAHLHTGSPVLDADCVWCESWMRSLEVASGLRQA